MQFSRRQKRITLGFLALGILIVLIVVGSIRFSSAKRDQQRYEQEKANMKAPEPLVLTVGTESRSRVRKYAAQLQPWMNADVPAEVAGRVVEVLVESGVRVETGSPLIRLDDQLALIARERALANQEEANRLVTEAERLKIQRAISETQYLAQVALARVADAALDEATEILKRHTIVAPFAGVINRRLVDVGDAIKVNEPVVQLVDLDKLRVEFYVSEQDLHAFPTGKPIELSIPSHPELKLEPKVDFVSRSADPSTRLYRVEAVLPNPDAQLPGGLQGVVKTEVDRFENLPFVPVAAVRFLGSRSLVWKVQGEDDTTQLEISVGPEVDGFYPVLSGLEAGDRVMIR